MDNNFKSTSKAIEDYYGKFAKSDASYKQGFKGTITSLQNVELTQINNYFANPENNYVAIGSLMDALYKKNGIVARQLNYLANHTTYNHNIYPELDPEQGLHSNVTMEDYLGAAKYLDAYNIKGFAPYFVLETLINGMSFFYEIQDKKGMTYLEFPLSMCRISGIENGVFRWMIDVSKLKSDDIDILPSEIRKAMESTDKSNLKKWVDNKWFKVSDKGIAFCFSMSAMKNGGIAISEFAPLLLDSILAEKAKENVEIKDNIDAVRIVHAKIPLTKDGEPSVSATQAGKWDKAMKRNLPDGIVGLVNPFEMDNITLNGAGNQKAYQTVKDAQAQMFYATGTSSAIFGSDTTSSNIVKVSVNKDAAWVYTRVLPMLENYYNQALGKYKSASGSIWRMTFLRQSNFTKVDDQKAYKDSVSMGGSRTDYLASMDMSPLEIYSKLYMEQSILNIDSLMLPKQTSYTMPGQSSDGAGRPPTSNPTDDTDRINDSN